MVCEPATAVFERSHIQYFPIKYFVTSNLVLNFNTALVQIGVVFCVCVCFLAVWGAGLDWGGGAGASPRGKNPSIANYRTLNFEQEPEL